jgi:calpain
MHNKGVLMGCSADGGTESLITLEGERTGIYSGHAYSIIDIFTMNYLDEEEKNRHENNTH